MERDRSTASLPIGFRHCRSGRYSNLFWGLEQGELGFGNCEQIAIVSVVAHLSVRKVQADPCEKTRT
jgi:hypothetical protein